VAHFSSCPLSIPDILTTSTMSSPFLTVTSPLLLRRHLLLISQRTPFASRCAATCCPLLLPIASCLPAGYNNASCCTATLHHLLLCRRHKCPSSTPAFICTGWLSNCILLRCLCLPFSCQHRCLLKCRCFTSPLHLLFAPTGCCVASWGTSASHPLAWPPLRLHLLLHLILIWLVVAFRCLAIAAIISSVAAFG
jgi:hypothetical protein